jgi:transcriptional repressor NrdR
VQCPSCQHTDSRVLESRAADSGRSVRRRRECLNCDFRFTTYERVETVPITVVKRSGSRETFNRSQAPARPAEGLRENRPGAGPPRGSGRRHRAFPAAACRREVTSNEIGELVLQRLQEMSEVAYVRFASVYRQFQGVSDFVATLDGLSSRSTAKGGKLRNSLAVAG